MCKLLEPMYSALHLVDTEVNPTMGLFYHVFDSMKKKLYPNTHFVEVGNENFISNRIVIGVREKLEHFCTCPYKATQSTRVKKLEELVCGSYNTKLQLQDIKSDITDNKYNLDIIQRLMSWWATIWTMMISFNGSDQFTLITKTRILTYASPHRLETKTLMYTSY